MSDWAKLKVKRRFGFARLYIGSQHRLMARAMIKRRLPQSYSPRDLLATEMLLNAR